MDAKLREHLEEILLAERDQAMTALHQAERDEAEAPAWTSGELARTRWSLADAASDTQEETADFIIATRASAHVAEIDDALRLLALSPHHLERCRRCHEPIERARLELVPWSRVCGRCVANDGRPSTVKRA
jgi:RNA polymerase-binding transcription factor DksA